MYKNPVTRYVQLESLTLVMLDFILIHSYFFNWISAVIKVTQYLYIKPESESYHTFTMVTLTANFLMTYSYWTADKNVKKE